MNTFLDIEIMITEGLPTTEEKLLLEKWHSISAMRSKVLPTPNVEEKLIAPQSQAHLLNGTGQSKIDDAVNKTKSKKESNAKILKDKQDVMLANTAGVWTKGLRTGSIDLKRSSLRKATSKKELPASEQQQRLQRSRTVAALAKSKDEFVSKEEVKHLLNGFARVIEFGTNHIDKKGNYNPTIDPNQNFVL